VLCLTLVQTGFAATNLLTNPGFENGTTGWFVLGGCTFTTTTAQKHSGSYSGKVSNRNQYWEGMAQSLLGKMQVGQKYVVSAWAMIENAPAGSAPIRIVMKKTVDGSDYYNWVCQTIGSNGQWVYMVGLYDLSSSGNLTDLYLYFEGPDPEINFYIDDVNVLLYEPPTSETNAAGEINFEDVYQELEGFGASGAWYQNWLTAHPLKSEIYDVAFGQSGIDIYRVRNSYGYDNGYITDTREIVQAAKARNPSLKIFNSAWTPPVYLKSNNDVNGLPPPATLKKDPNGLYMYDQYADWWADSLAAYESNSVHTDYMSIQNEPDLEIIYDSCKFLPTETNSYAGYNKAFEAVYQELYSRMGPNMPKMVGPETMGFSSAMAYIDSLIDANHAYGFAHHPYLDGTYNYPDGFIPGMQAFAQKYGYKPLMQTEYAKQVGYTTIADFDAAMETAQHIHNSFVYEGVCMYLYWDVFWGDGGFITLDNPWTDPDPNYTINPVYYAVKHYSAFTDPGWRLVGAVTDSNGLRITTFKSPDETKLTVVILNISPTVDVNLSLFIHDFNATGSEVYQTTSDANFAYIGAFNESQPLLLLPKKSITTVRMWGYCWNWRPLMSGMDPFVRALTVYDDALIAGGEFRTAGGVDVDYIAQWDGSSWQPVGGGMDHYVRSLMVYDGELIAGGDFIHAGGVDANCIARWDGSKWHSLGIGLNHMVYALTAYDGQLVAGGDFSTAGGVNSNHIARWDGSDWQSLGSGIDGRVYALTVYDGRLVAGGDFNTAGGVNADYIACWDGNDWQPLGSGMDDTVRAFTVYDGQLIAGGHFNTAGGVGADYIARWDGSSWQPVGSGMNMRVIALTVYDGELIAGGEFSEAGGITASRIAGWDGSSWQPLDSGMNDRVYALTVYEGELIAGGDFTTAGGISANRIARRGLSVIYRGDLNHDGTVNMFDVDWFSERWLEGNCFINGWCYEADLDCDFIVNLEDYALLVKQWLEGP
jgi:O-glycosyl hydrolase